MGGVAVGRESQAEGDYAGECRGIQDLGAVEPEPQTHQGKAGRDVSEVHRAVGRFRVSSGVPGIGGGRLWSADNAEKIFPCRPV